MRNTAISNVPASPLGCATNSAQLRATMKSPRKATIPTIKANRHESKTATSNAPLSGAARYFNRGRFDDLKFFDETFLLQGGDNHASLHRDLNGRLFVRRYEMDSDDNVKFYLREVTYVEACVWLVQNQQCRPPEKFLAFFGIQAPATPSA